MTSSRESIRAAELRAPDHLPACPKCGDLGERGATVCEVCGARLVPLKAPKVKLRCVYCGVPVTLRDQSKRVPVPPATCRVHRDLPALDPHYGGYPE